jgi:hypothetical protein
LKSIAKGAFWSHSSLQLLWPEQQILNHSKITGPQNNKNPAGFFGAETTA